MSNVLVEGQIVDNLEEDDTTSGQFPVNPLMRSMDFPIFIIWMSPLSFLGALGVIFIFISYFDEILVSKQNSPRWDAACCFFTSGAILFALVPKKEARLIWVNPYSNKKANDKITSAK